MVVTMIDFSKIKTKSIVTVSWQGKDIECEVVQDTPSACTIKLPDNSITTLGKMHVKAVKDTVSKTTQDKE